jgi:hypothetical protein
VPEDVDMFDAGLVPGGKPRLFIDMIAFVDMARDRRVYRLVQDSRAGRVIIAESERIDTMVDAITNYIARRLVERDKALAGAAQPLAYAPPLGSDADAPRRDAHDDGLPARPGPKQHRATPRDGRWRDWFGSGFSFLLQFLGSVVLVALLWAAAYFMWTGYLRVLWAAYIG